MMSHIRDFSRFLRISSTAAALATHPPAHDGPSRPSNAPPRGPRSPPVAWRAWGLVPHIPRPQSRPPRPTLPPLPPLNARCPAAARRGGGRRSPSFATTPPASPRCIPKHRGARVEVPVQAEGTRGSERVRTGSQPQRSRARASHKRVGDAHAPCARWWHAGGRKKNSHARSTRRKAGDRLAGEGGHL